MNPSAALTDLSAGGAGRLIAVASGKGGVGKTVLSVSLAQALSRRHRVLLFDGDLGLANVDVQLGLTPERDLGAVIAGWATLAECVTPYPAGGFDILSGRSGSGALSAIEPPVLEQLLASLQALAPHYDAVLLDLGAGLERVSRRMAAFADLLLVVATADPTSLTDAYAVLKLRALDRPGGEARIVVNQAASRAEAARTYAALQRACAAFLGWSPPLAGIVRQDEKLREAIRRQALLLTRHPTSGAASDIEQISAGLI